MPGGIFTTKYDWEKKFLIFPRKIDNKWCWLCQVYKQVTFIDTYDDYHMTHKVEYKTPKQYLLDELRDRND